MFRKWAGLSDRRQGGGLIIGRASIKYFRGGRVIEGLGTLPLPTPGVGTGEGEEPSRPGPQPPVRPYPSMARPTVLLLPLTGMRGDATGRVFTSRSDPLVGPHGLTPRGKDLTPEGSRLQDKYVGAPWDGWARTRRNPYCPRVRQRTRLCVGSRSPDDLRRRAARPPRLRRAPGRAAGPGVRSLRPRRLASSTRRARPAQGHAAPTSTRGPASAGGHSPSGEEQGPLGRWAGGRGGGRATGRGGAGALFNGAQLGGARAAGLSALPAAPQARPGPGRWGARAAVARGPGEGGRPGAGGRGRGGPGRS